MNREVQIAVAWGSPGGAAAEISLAIEELTGQRPKPVRLTDLAGPNETIQVLLNNQEWILVAKAVIAIYGAELAKEAAKATWKKAAPKFEQAVNITGNAFGRLITAIGSAIHAQAPVILGFPKTPISGRRHIGVEILEATPDEIARIVCLFAGHGEEIERKLDEWDLIRAHQRHLTYQENSDCSVMLTISDEGAIQLTATILDDTFTKREVVIYELFTP
ncbi:MAG: hypothetical protein ACREPB_00725 [Arenimonas sp.]